MCKKWKRWSSYPFESRQENITAVFCKNNKMRPKQSIIHPSVLWNRRSIIQQFLISMLKGILRKKDVLITPPGHSLHLLQNELHDTSKSTLSLTLHYLYAMRSTIFHYKWLLLWTTISMQKFVKCVKNAKKNTENVQDRKDFFKQIL